MIGAAVRAEAFCLFSATKFFSQGHGLRYRFRAAYREIFPVFPEKLPNMSDGGHF
jgi:hypothetical protein